MFYPVCFDGKLIQLEGIEFIFCLIQASFAPCVTLTQSFMITPPFNVISHSLLIFSEMVIFRPPHLHSKLEPSKAVFKGTVESFYMKKFLDESVHGLAGEMTPDNQDQFKKPLCVVYYNVDYKLNAKGGFFFLLNIYIEKVNVKGTRSGLFSSLA